MMRRVSASGKGGGLMVRNLRWILLIGLCSVRASAAQEPPVSATSPEPSSAAMAVGQRISLDLKGVDILDVLKLLSQKSGLNFVAGRNVSGRVTIFVNDVDVWHAFELIIGANDLAYERRGDIVTVMMSRDYELIFGEKFQERKESFVRALRYAKVVQVATVLNQIKSSVGRVVADEATNTLIVSDVPVRLQEMEGLLIQLDRPTESRIYQLNYADAEKLKEKMQELLSPVGTFTFDTRTNTVVISDLTEVLQKAEPIIQAFDTPDSQVLIEARIVNVNLSDNHSLGIDWQRLFSGIDINTRGNFLSRELVTSSVLSGGTGATLQVLSSKEGTKAVIEALQSIGKTETLSNPRVMVSNNQEAKILVGTREAFVTTTTTVPTSGPTVSAPEVQFQDVGTKLFVTPQIKHDGRIQLKIRPEVSSVSRTITSVANTIIPIVKTTEAETNVLVQSGSTLIIGGLIDTRDERNDNQVPWIGNIPVIGLPFKSTTTEQTKSELVVFLTPQIMLPDGTPSTLPTDLKPSAHTPVAQILPALVIEDPLPLIYRQAVRLKLQDELAKQFQRASLSAGSVEVEFILNHLGQVTGSPAVSSQQGELFIKAAHVALQQAQPFAPFPEGATSSTVRFHVAVQYAPD